MKLLHGLVWKAEVESHPSRGAWIEMWYVAQHSADAARRTPHGVRGLKFDFLG